MKNQKLIALAAVVSGLLMITPAFADLIVIDDFSVSQNPISDTVKDSIPVSETNTMRTLSINLRETLAPTQSSAEITTSFLDINNGVGEDSEVIVSWVLRPHLFPIGVTSTDYYFMIVETDNNPTNVTFQLNGLDLASFTMGGKLQKAAKLFTMDAVQFARINLGGTMTMKINGDSGWDMAIDTFGFSYTPSAIIPTPEPNVIGLLSLSLASLAFLSRKTNSLIS